MNIWTDIYRHNTWKINVTWKDVILVKRWSSRKANIFESWKYWIIYIWTFTGNQVDSLKYKNILKHTNKELSLVFNQFFIMINYYWNTRNADTPIYRERKIQTYINLILKWYQELSSTVELPRRHLLHYCFISYNF